jgi:hypothetical protein
MDREANEERPCGSCSTWYISGIKREDGQQSPKKTANRLINRKKSVAKPPVAVKASERLSYAQV